MTALNWLARRQRWRSLVFVALVLPLAAVADADPTPPVPSGKLIVLPMNVEDVPPEYLADGTEILDVVLAEQLRRAGVDFVQLSLVDGIRRWAGAIEAIGGLVVDLDGISTESVERARRRLVTSLAQEFDAVGVVWPDVRERRGKANDGKLFWDGASRVIPGDYEARLVHTPAAGSSIRMRLFDSDGALVHDAHVALEVIHRFQVLDTDYSYRQRRIWYEYRVRSDLFEDEGLLREAIRASLPQGLR